MTVSELAQRLPAASLLVRWCQSLALLDAILSPQRKYRYFSFDAFWGPDEQMASMSNGSGDEYSIVFATAGTYLRGFDHESDLSPFIRQPPAVQAGLWESVPAALESARTEPAFTMDGIPSVTIALWRLRTDNEWSFGQATAPEIGDDGGTWLFEQLDGSEGSYTSFAQEYYERDIDAATVERIMGYAPIREQDVVALNAELTLAELDADLAQIRYPMGP